jgi:hypothetical protein
MAKSSVPGLDRIRELFTSAERAVLESTAGRSLVEASRKQLDATLAQARAFRDKWRDLHATQSRAAKRKGAGAAANARSREKTDMFTAAIDRLQGRLAEFGLAPGAGRPAKKSLTKAARRTAHRTTRAGVKGELASTAAEITRRRAPQPAARAVGKAAAAGGRVAPATPARPVPAIVKPAKRGQSKKRRPAKTAAVALAKGGGQSLRFDVTKQRSAKASATAARLKLDGKVTRRGGHVLAAGKRRQATRDRRGR